MGTWSSNFIPELEQFPADQRAEIAARAMGHHLMYWQGWLMLPFVFLCVIGARFLAAALMPGITADMVAGAVGLGVGFAIYYQVARRYAGAYLREQLRGLESSKESGRAEPAARH